MLDLRGLGELDRLLRLGVLQELHVGLRLRVLLHVLEIQSEGAEPLRLREFDRVVRLHRDGLSRHRAVQTAILDAGIQTLAGLVSDRQEVLARHLRSAREEPKLLQAGDFFIAAGLEGLWDFLGEVRCLRRNPLDPQVVVVWHQIGGVLRSDLYRRDAACCSTRRFVGARKSIRPPRRRKTSAMTNAAMTVLPMPVGSTTRVDRSRHARAMFTWYARSSTAPRRRSSCVTNTAGEPRGPRKNLCVGEANDGGPVRSAADGTRVRGWPCRTSWDRRPEASSRRSPSST